jgi:hypothetical protein
LHKCDVVDSENVHQHLQGKAFVAMSMLPLRLVNKHVDVTSAGEILESPTGLIEVGLQATDGLFWDGGLWSSV